MTERSAWLDAPPWGLADHVIARLEATARAVAAEWGLTLGARIAAGRYSFVAPADDHAILKVTPVDDDQADHEADALALWDGDGAVRLLRHDPPRRALLLERARPGTDAVALGEVEAAAALMSAGRRIWRAPRPDQSFRTVHDWVERWVPRDAAAHPLAPEARRIYESMDIGVNVVVHGDLHHYNLLRDGARWVVIDPKPILGEPEFDIPTFLWNPLARWAETRTALERRIRLFVDAGLDGERIRRWAIVRGVGDGLPVRPGQPESRQLRVARALL